MTKIVGIAYQDYISKKSGNHVQGFQVSFLSDEGFHGIGYQSLTGFVSRDEMDTILYNADLVLPDGYDFKDEAVREVFGSMMDRSVRIFYNRFGNISSFDIR